MILRAVVSIVSVTALATVLAVAIAGENDLGSTRRVPTWQVEAVLAALKDPSADVRYMAVNWLSGREVQDERLAREVVEYIRPDAQPVMKVTAMKALASMGAAGAVFAPQVAALLQDSESAVRSSAADALGRMGAAGAVFAPRVAALLQDSESAVRSSAADALGRMDAAGAVFAPQLAALLKDSALLVRQSATEALARMGPAQVSALLKDSNYDVRESATAALTSMGPAGAAFAPQMAALLKDSNYDVRESAAAALASMGEAGAVFAPRVAALLKDSNHGVRESAVAALASMGAAGAVFAPRVAALLKDSDVHVRRAAAAALASMGAGGVAFAPQVAALLKDSNQGVRESAAAALASMGAEGAVFAPQVAALLTDLNYGVRESAAAALASMGAAGAAFASQVAALLKDSNYGVRESAAEALVGMGAAGAAFAPQIAALLKNSNGDVRKSAAAALDEMVARVGPAQDLSVLFSCLTAAHLWRTEAESLRLQAYLYRKVSPRDLILIRWLGNRGPGDRPTVVDLDRQSKLSVLEAFSDVWNDAEKFPELRNEMAERGAEIVRSQAWQLKHVAFLEGLKNRFNQAELPDQALAIQAALEKIEWHDRLRTGLLSAGIHLSGWLALVFAYPRWPWVRSLFFWNKWVRRFVGLGYVGTLITVVPWLRRRMLAPFRESLVPHGVVEQYNEHTYFADCDVVLGARGRPQGSRQQLREVLGSIRGQVVLQGQSGLGKTLLLLRLALAAKQPVVFLRATECSTGVVVAIQKKVQAQVRDANYLRALICAGALDVLIDGLDEASPEARSRITQFAEDYFKGNFILATQPISWDPPATARVYILQPLRPDQIEPFLLQQWESVRGCVTLNQEQYTDAVQRYVAAIPMALDESKAADPRLAALGNPMDATLAAELLAIGETPDVFRLVEQHYRVMAGDFRQMHGIDFPLRRFSERVYEARSSGDPYVRPQDFDAEVASLTGHKLMIRCTERVKKEKREEEVNRWFFRHDKIMEFFLLPAFMDEEKSARKYDHVQDGQFIGVYELLAVRLPDKEEENLQQFLIGWAADTNESELLNRYTRARRLRPASSPSATLIRATGQ